MFLSKEATYKDQSLQIQMMLSFDKESSNNSENVWEIKVFWGGTKKRILQLQTQISRKIC